LALAIMGALGAGLLLPGCYAPQLTLLRSGLDSLRVVVDTLTVRDSVTRFVLEGARRDLAEQKDILPQHAGFERHHDSGTVRADDPAGRQAR
jgi:hypothetical protein